jgi:hypothetical protein
MEFILHLLFSIAIFYFLRDLCKKRLKQCEVLYSKDEIFRNSASISTESKENKYSYVGVCAKKCFYKNVAISICQINVS